MEVIQQLVVTAAGNSDVTMTAYDSSSWSVICQWKGGTVAQGTLALLPKRRSLIGAADGKPLMHVWTSESTGSQQPEGKNILSGTISSLVCTSDENYCIAAVKESLYVWLLSTGDLLTILPAAHFQPISALAVTADNERVITGSHDTRIKIYSIFHLIDHQDMTGNVNELFTLSGHTMPITALNCGTSDVTKPWLFSSALDKSVKVWEINYGTLLATFILEFSPVSMAIDAGISQFFVGGSEGEIISISLKPEKSHPPVSMITNTRELTFSGHSSKITSLRISIDSTVLFSASLDKSVKVWLISSHQCLRTLDFLSPVTNVAVSTVSSNVHRTRTIRERLPNFSREVIPPVKLKSKCIPVKNMVDYPDELFESAITDYDFETDLSESKKLKRPEVVQAQINDKFAELFKRASQR